MCEPAPQPPPTPPPQDQPPQAESTRKPQAHVASVFSAFTHRSRNSLIRQLQNVPQTTVQDFTTRVLPPLPPVFGDREDAVSAVVAKLQTDLGGGSRPLTKVGKTYVWSALPQHPKDVDLVGHEAFQPLEKIADQIIAVVDDCEWRKGFPVPKPAFQYVNNGNKTLESHHRRTTTKSRPAGYFLPSSQPRTGVRHKWWDIGAVGEFNLVDSHDNLADDAAKVLWSMNTLMREDPRRRFAYGFTIENTTTRLWYCDRTQIICSMAFSFCKKPQYLVSFFLATLYADETSQGWDPTIVRVPIGQRDPQYQCQYDITVHQRDANGGVEEVVYRTETLLSQLAAGGIYGRGTRVWTARRVVGGSTKGQPLVVIKDCWVDADRDREGHIMNALRQDVCTRGSEAERQALLDHIPTIVSHGDVWIAASSRDQTRSFKDIIKRDNTGQIVSFDLLTGLHPVHEAVDEGTSSNFSQSLYVRHPIKNEILLPDLRTHYRIVFQEYGRSLHKERSLRTAFIVIRGVMNCLAAVHRMGWVHRDISVGNILVVTETRDDKLVQRGLLTDFEYAKRCAPGDKGAHKARTGTEYFMSVEVDSHAYRFYPAPDEWKADPIPGLLEDVILGTAMPEGVEEPSPPTQASEPPFQHHPLNDWESLWWVSMYMVVDRAVIDKSGLPGETFRKQMSIARTLFYDYGSRLSFFTDPGEGSLEKQLLECVHRDVLHVVKRLLRLRLELVYAYVSVEKDVTQQPDPQRSLKAITVRFPAAVFSICKYLEPLHELRIEPFPTTSSASLGDNADDEDTD